jgi:hypothetical protein
MITIPVFNERERTMRVPRIGLGFAVMVLAAVASFTSPAHAREGRVENRGLNRHVTGQLRSFETCDPQAVAVISPKECIRHNLAVAEGLEGFGALLK